ncbi:nucleoside hydrolase [Brevibacterium sp. 91QC2O2]|uniref:nucleoside hydrolase n=1 Tax=Brevibacterium TaxID=1696 RepID=UPI00211CA3F8|nr:MULTISPECIES: nucleoside hydrolase [unclassified Brevibacterium]MCQ9367668.1 nucleoside hydrolase [Brevibacterium sp. 91QC2O2]MCQ9385857.1 nucleoside hydrolase [Brevibacterium sp. 68QC2CO]
MHAPKIPLFLDCDPGIDDAIALGYVLCRPDVDLVGVAASGGNVPTAQVTANALGWLALAGDTSTPVHPGSDLPLAHLSGERTGDPVYADDTHGPTGAGYAQLPEHTAPSPVSAAQAWVDAARAHPGELIGVVIGPATNLALALDIEPELPRLVRRLFIMGGAFNYRGNTHPTTEWNVTFDPESTARVIREFGTKAPVLPVIAPIEATEAVVMTPQRLNMVLRYEHGAGWHAWLEQLAQALKFYFEFHQWDGHGYLAHIHDPFVVAAALAWAHSAPAASAPAPIPWSRTATTAADVELTGTLTRGETVADWLGRWDRPDNLEIIRSIDSESFIAHLLTTLGKGPKA